MSEVTDVDKMVEEYVKLRDIKSEIKAAYEDKQKVLDKQMEEIEQKILEVCKATGVEALRTSHGTATRTIKTRIWTNDWPTFYAFMKEQDAPELLEKRIAQGNFKEWMEDNPGVVAPVNIDRQYAITVRRK